MMKIAKTIAIVVAVTCMFAMSSTEASAQCARGGYGGFNSYGNVGGVYSSGYRGTGFNSGYGGKSRGLSINVNSRPSYNGSRSNLYRTPGRSYSSRGRYGY